MLMRYHHGERQIWCGVHVPSVAAEEQRHRHRDLETLQHERARTTNRIKGWLRSQGGRRSSVGKVPDPLEALRLWANSPIPSGLYRRWLRVYAHYTLLSEQSAALEAERRNLRRPSPEGNVEKGRRLRQRKGLGITGAWVLVRECFGWHEGKNRRAVGAWRV
jgi:transposase